MHLFKGIICVYCMGRFLSVLAYTLPIEQVMLGNKNSYFEFSKKLLWLLVMVVIEKKTDLEL